jgi:hypothetical protein
MQSYYRRLCGSIAIAMILAAMFVVTLNIKPALSDAGWWNSSWSYRKKMTIDHTKVSADLVNFPVLVDVVDSDLKSKALSNGYDIAFTDASETKLDHEIELYNSGTGHAIAWVNVPSVSSTVDTVIYMYYGNPSASNQQNIAGTWDSSFKIVEHLRETSGTQYDSTANHNDGTPSGGITEGTSGEIDGADHFNGVDGSVSCGYSGFPSGSSDRTLEAWVTTDLASKGSDWRDFFGYGNDGVGYAFFAGQSGTSGHLGEFFVGRYGEDQLSGYVLSTNTWYHLAVTLSGSVVKFYVNGTLTATKSFSGAVNTQLVYAHIGQLNNPHYYWNGTIDEVRLSASVRSGAWISASYYSEDNKLITIGSEEISPYLLTLQITPTSITCRKCNETFPVSIAVSNENNLDGFQFEIYYNTTLLDYAKVEWNAWTSGDITVDEANGKINGTTSGMAVSGVQTLVTIKFNATYLHIWKDESEVPGWKNSQTGVIFLQGANLSFVGSPNLEYVRGGTNQINVGPDVSYTFSPIQGDVDNSGSVDVFDLRVVAAYYDQANTTYDLNGDGIVDIFDIVGVSSNFGYAYP